MLTTLCVSHLDPNFQSIFNSKSVCLKFEFIKGMSNIGTYKYIFFLNY